MSTLAPETPAHLPPTDLANHCRSIASRARQASIELASVTGAEKSACLRAAAAQIRADAAEILAANQLDLAAAPGYGLSPAAIDRLTLDAKRLESIAAGVEAVALQSDPVGEVLEEAETGGWSRKC